MERQSTAQLLPISKLLLTTFEVSLLSCVFAVHFCNARLFFVVNRMHDNDVVRGDVDYLGRQTRSQSRHRRFHRLPVRPAFSPLRNDSILCLC